MSRISQRGTQPYEECYISHIENEKTSVSGKTIKLQDIPFYHGDMSRNVAETILLANGKEGTYLLRSSKKHSGYTVSVRCHDSIKHFVVSHDKVKNIYVFGVATFYSLQELLEHFESIPVVSSETTLPVVLRYPYRNDIAEHHWYTDINRHGECGKHSGYGTEDSAPDLTVASKEGYLEKRGGFRKSWKERWFVVQKNSLKYFDNRKKENPISVLDLSQASEVAEDYIDNKKNCFRLVFPTRTYYFVAKTPVEVKDWIEFFQWKIDHCRENKDQ